MRDSRGFTILELILALTAITLIAAIAIPAHFAEGSVTLENAAVLLARDLRATQNRAAYLGESTHVVFSQDGYEVRDERGQLLYNPRTHEPFERSYSHDGVFRGVHLEVVRFGGDRTLAYDERGHAAESGEVVVSFGGDQRIVRVDAVTGDLEIVGTTSGWADPGY